MTLISDLRYAARMIRKTPGVSAVAVLSLALGIGANTAIFSLVDAMLLKLLPVRAPEELFVLTSGRPERPNTAWTYPDYVAMRDGNTTLAGLALTSGGLMPLGMQPASGGATDLIHGLIVSGNFFQVLGVEPAIGRLFTAEEDRAPSASPYVLLSYDFWRSRFQGDANVLGRVLRLNGHPMTVVGVTPRGFRSTDVAVAPQVYVPALMRGEITGNPFANWNNRNNAWLLPVARLRPGGGIPQAEGELSTLYKLSEEAERRTAPDPKRVNSSSPVRMVPAARGYSGTRNRLGEPLLIVMVVVGLVLLIACANVANLMLARGAARQREIAVRLAIGASRRRLTAQLLTESIALSVLGGAVGVAVAYAGVTALLEFLPQAGFTRATLAISPDWRLFGFTAGVSLLTGVLFGLVPAVQSTRPALIAALKEGTPGAGSSRFGLRNVLVVSQVALSLLLVIGAGLFARSMDRLRSVQTGFRRDHAMVVTVDPIRSGYNPQRTRTFYERLLEMTERTPGVQSASLGRITPLSGSRTNNFLSVEGGTELSEVDLNAVGSRFFETMGIPVRAGRVFRVDDSPVEPNAPGSPRVAVVNESFAKRYFEGRNPIGRRLSFSERFDPARSWEIVGVVGDVHYYGLRQPPASMVYTALWAQRMDFHSLVVRTSDNAAGVAEAVRRHVASLDPSLPVLALRTVEDYIDNNLLVDRLLATLSGFFGLLALLLAAVGLYGVVSYAVTRRTREIGVRMALGAERGSVLWLVARYAGGLVLAGAAMGIPAALALARYVKSFLFGIEAQDATAIAGATLTLLAAAAVAAFVPACRAARVDPIVALRHE